MTWFLSKSFKKCFKMFSKHRKYFKASQIPACWENHTMLIGQSNFSTTNYILRIFYLYLEYLKQTENWRLQDMCSKFLPADTFLPVDVSLKLIWHVISQTGKTLLIFPDAFDVSFKGHLRNKIVSTPDEIWIRNQHHFL